MTSTQLPPLDFDDGGLHIVLLPEIETVSSPLSPGYPQGREPSSHATLSSARYSEHDRHAGVSESDDDHQGGADADEIDRRSDSTPPPQIPVHPIPALQHAFAESLQEVMSGAVVEKPKLRALDAQGRRDAVLAQGKDEPAFDAVWRLRPGQTQHELAKLIAQISFGVYLMLNGMANNNTQVVNILQGHIDEVDEFLEVTIEDLAHVQMDLERRIDHLMLPMSNVAVFEQLLEDRKFRTEILEGNEKIEHILARTNAAMKQWDDDIEAGLQTSNVFISWLNEHAEGPWRSDQPDVIDIFDAMGGNAEGWLIAFEKISDSAQDINSLIVRLMNIISDMENKAGEASRRTWTSIAPFSAPPMHGSRDASSPEPQAALDSPPPTSSTQESIRSGSTEKRPASSMTDMDDASSIDFPLPGGLPLLPPFRSARYTSNTFGLGSPLSVTTTSGFDSPQSAQSAQYTPQSISNHTFGFASPQSMHIHLRQDSITENEDSDRETETARSDDGDEPVFLLQPRTYTPQPPAPLPSPLIKDEPGHGARSGSQSTLESLESAPFSPAADTQSSTWRAGDAAHRRTSLRERVSQKMIPPGDIQIPARSLKGMEIYAQSPGTTTPQTMTSHHFDSAYESDAERHGRHLSGSSSNLTTSPPQLNVVPSPRSDRQRYYHPVHASPHSPLQQRPHTAVGHGQSAHHQAGSTLAPPHHPHNSPSGAGVSTPNNVASADGDDGTSQSVRTTKTVDKQLKKKKSAFGWLKKAFSMDEEERAAYEARKAMQYQGSYYNADPPKFLDGRRLR
ncbi:hypothetical protein Trco_002782 [Trichoderma cornu-damae]|uniref:Uncharacterized protein n=1 Tax=Trichoderma cornu-damae TaxID=654480 RepID=A0A9P8QQK7_9HYPO|nr:hypothetical protein Trco_002782 [Trichoderma cornu-damae]